MSRLYKCTVLNPSINSSSSCIFSIKCTVATFLLYWMEPGVKWQATIWSHGILDRYQGQQARTLSKIRGTRICCLYRQGVVLHRGPRQSRRCSVSLSIDTSVNFDTCVMHSQRLSVKVITNKPFCHFWWLKPLLYTLIMQNRLNSCTNRDTKIHIFGDQGHTIVYSFTRNGRAWTASSATNSVYLK